MRKAKVWRRIVSLLPLSSSFLLLILIKTGITEIDPNILSKTTPRG